VSRDDLDNCDPDYLEELAALLRQTQRERRSKIAEACE
jgi:hypothetical protein